MSSNSHLPRPPLDEAAKEWNALQHDIDLQILERSADLAMLGDRGTDEGQPGEPLQGSTRENDLAAFGHFSLESADAPRLEDSSPSCEPLDRTERRGIIDQARALLESFYVHLPMKRALHGVDPIQRLNVLENRLEDPAELPTAEFHREMCEIFALLCDRHTLYFMPRPPRGQVAFLGIRIEDCRLGDDRRVDQRRFYVIAHAAADLEQLVRGGHKERFCEALPGRDTAESKVIEVLRWNGIPIERAIEINADQHNGSNPAARHARGLSRLTLRPLDTAPRPDEDRVTIGFRILDRKTKRYLPADREEELVIELPWRRREYDVHEEPAIGRPDRSLDAEADVIQQMSRSLYGANGKGAGEVPARQAFRSGYVTRDGDLREVPPEVPDDPANEGLYDGWKSPRSDECFGYLRIFTFNVEPRAFACEFLRRLRRLPQESLIVDVRGNGGGSIWAAERVLQFLSPRTVEPMRFQLRNTALARHLCRLHSPSRLFPGLDFSDWAGSLDRDVQTGEAYSRAYPVTRPATCNVVGQRYWGPVVLITDALSYSATEIFAAGFQDHGMGQIIGVDGRTGGGGANVFEHRELLRLASAADSRLSNSPIRVLPGNVEMSVAFRRALRVGDRAGMPLESFGVEADERLRYQMTVRDVLDENKDLVRFAAGVLAGQNGYDLHAIEPLIPKTGGWRLRANLSGLDRLEILVDGCVQEVVETVEIDTVIPGPLDRPFTLELRGYQRETPADPEKPVDALLPEARRERLVARRRIWVNLEAASPAGAPGEGVTPE